MAHHKVVEGPVADRVCHDVTFVADPARCLRAFNKWLEVSILDHQIAGDQSSISAVGIRVDLHIGLEDGLADA